jgi:hypothetical protein
VVLVSCCVLVGLFIPQDKRIKQNTGSNILFINYLVADIERAIFWYYWRIKKNVLFLFCSNLHMKGMGRIFRTLASEICSF